MRVADGDGRGSKEQWHPPGKAEQYRPAIALDVAVHVDGIEGCAEYRAWQKQPGYYPSRMFHISFRLEARGDRKGTPLPYTAGLADPR